MKQLSDVLLQNPLIAILRGVSPDRVISIGEKLVDCGFCCIEIPMNSPEPLTSIQLLAEKFSDRALIGAGTVTTTAEIKAIYDHQGKLIVMPHTDAALIKASIQLGLDCVPGFSTVTEAMHAMHSGATALKFFPAAPLSSQFLKSVKAVLPKHIPVVPTGGITPNNMAEFIEAGACGFGLGGELFKLNYSDQDIEKRAKDFIVSAKSLNLIK